MAEPKPLASLSSTLLARKGFAKPAMRPQGFSGFGMSTAGHDDLGWNDMGQDPAPAAIPQPISPAVVAFKPEPPPVLRQREELERELRPVVAPVPVEPEFDEAEQIEEASYVAPPLTLAPPVAAAPPAPVKLVRAAAGSKGKAAFTLRLDPERHLKLRLVCAVMHKSAQSTVIAALDAFLDSHSATVDAARAPMLK